jgi:hypothetical protein
MYRGNQWDWKVALGTNRGGKWLQIDRWKPFCSRKVDDCASIGAYQARKKKSNP